MELIPIRKPRPFAGASGQAIKDLYSSIHGAIGIISIRGFDNDKSNYNTEAVVLMEEGTLSIPPTERTVLYRRLDLQRALSLAGLKDPELGFSVTPRTPVTHPMEPEKLIKVLNSVCKCDFATSDFTVTHTDGNQYTLVCLPDSLGYFGSADISVGDAEVVLVSTENALMYSQESVVTPTGVMINGVSVDLTASEQIKNTGVLFKEFQLEGGKLTYLLNFNAHNLSIDLASPAYNAATANINETVTLENGNIILYKFTEPTTMVPEEPINVPNRIRATTWLNNEIELSQVFRISINGVNKSVTELIASQEVELLLVGNVVELTNLTYNDMLVELRARTISLPSLEDQSLKFLTFDEEYPLVGGYEVYKFNLAAMEAPLTQLNLGLAKVDSANYTALLTKLGWNVGAPSSADYNSRGEAIKVNNINTEVDEYSIYSELLESSKVTFNANTLRTNEDVFKYGLHVLATVRIPKESVDRLIDASDLNKTIITLNAYNATSGASSNPLSYNALNQMCIVDPMTGDMYLGLVEGISTGTNYILSYPEVAGRHLAGEFDFVVHHSSSGKLYPEFSFLTAEKVDELNQLNEGLDLPHPPEFLTIPETGFTGVTALITPTLAEYADGDIDYKFNYALVYNEEVTKLLNYVNVTNVPEDTLLVAVTPRNTNLNAVGYLNIEPLSLSVGEYLSDGISPYRDINNGYVLIGDISGKINLMELNYSNGVSRVAITSNDFDFTADLDGAAGTLFQGVFFGDQPIEGTHIVNRENIETFQMFYPTDAADLMVSPDITAVWNLEGNHSVRSVSDHNIVVNVAAPLPEGAAIMIPIEVTIEEEELAHIVNVYGPTITVKSFDVLGDEVVHADAVPVMDVFKIINGRVFLFIDGYAGIAHTVTLDMDGAGQDYESVSYTFSHDIRIINRPADTTLVVKDAIDSEVQDVLLSLPPTDKEVIKAGPFVTYANPTKVISDVKVDYEVNKTVVDGTVKDVSTEEQETIGLVFETFLTDEELNDDRPDEDVVGTLSTVGEEPVTIEITRGLFRKQSFVYDGNIHFYLGFDVSSGSEIAGNYVLTIDWDGHGSDDAYTLDRDEDFNLYLKQVLNFQLDVGVEYQPEPELFPLSFVPAETDAVTYNALAAKLNATIGEPSDVILAANTPVFSSMGEALVINNLNTEIDNYAKATDAVLITSETEKTFKTDLFTYGLKFLDMFRISADSYAKLLTVTDRTETLFTVTRFVGNEDLQEIIEVSLNVLDTLGVVESSTGDFIFGFVQLTTEYYQTSFTCSERVKKFAATNVELVTNYFLHGGTTFRTRYVDKAYAAELRRLNPELLVNDPTEFLNLPATYGTANSMEEFSGVVTPTMEELSQQFINYSFDYAVIIDKNYVKLMDVFGTTAGDDDVIMGVVAGDTELSPQGFISVPTIAVTAGQYKANGFSDIVDADGNFVLIGTVNGAIGLSEVRFDETGVINSMFMSNPCEAVGDLDGPDGLQNTTYTRYNSIVGSFEIHRNEVIYPEFFYPTDIDEILPTITEMNDLSGYNSSGKYNITNVEPTELSIVLGNVDDSDAQLIVPIEVGLTVDEIAELETNFPDARVTIDGITADGTVVTIAYRQPISSVFANVIDGRSFAIGDFTTFNSFNVQIDLDGESEALATKVTTLNNNAIKQTSDLLFSYAANQSEALASTFAGQKPTVSINDAIPLAALDYTVNDALDKLDITIKPGTVVGDKSIVVAYRIDLDPRIMDGSLTDYNLYIYEGGVGEVKVTIDELKARGVVDDKGIALACKVPSNLEVFRMYARIEPINDNVVIVEGESATSGSIEYGVETIYQISCDGTSSAVEIEVLPSVSGSIEFTDDTTVEFANQDELKTAMNGKLVVVELEPWQPAV